jgi:hypothetical protein
MVVLEDKVVTRQGGGHPPVIALFFRQLLHHLQCLQGITFQEGEVGDFNAGADMVESMPVRG